MDVCQVVPEFVIGFELVTSLISFST